MLLGVVLILFGIIMTLYTFGAVESVTDLFHLPNVLDYVALAYYYSFAWFFLVIRHYIKKSTEKLGMSNFPT